MTTREQQLRQIFAINEEHIIELGDARERTWPSGERSSLFYRERDSSDQLVACYRVWTQQSSKPPFKSQSGFEKFSPDGTLQDREMRFGQAMPDDSSDIRH